MTDTSDVFGTDFESAVERRVRAYAAAQDRLFDADAITHQAAASGRSVGRWILWRPIMDRPVRN